MNDTAIFLGDGEQLPPELLYVALLFALFVVPRILQRFRLPTAITSFFLGALSGLAFGLFVQDQTVALLSTFGIVALFLFAGLEVEVADIRRGAWILGQHLLVRLVLLVAGTILITRIFSLGTRAASLVALALLTPSTGFILGSLDTFGLSEGEKFWVKSKAIGSELLALFTLFVALQSTTWTQMGLSTLALVGLIGLLPVVFWAFARWVVPYAPKSEFAFLLMVAVVCAFATRRLGVYYLVGAFLVGMAAQRFSERLPTMTSGRTLYAVEVFASFFAPFYFFNAGLHLRRQDFVPESLLIGLGFVAAAIPLQYFTVALQRRFVLGESKRNSTRVAVALLPTLVFTLVLAGILRDDFAVAPSLFGGLIIYAVCTTLLPGLILHLPPPEYDAPHLPEEMTGRGSRLVEPPPE